MKTCKHGQNLIVSVLICCFAGAAFMQPALAASTDLANVPMAVNNSVAPNIMFTLDNSGSMGWIFMPDDVYYSGNGRNNCFENATYNQIYYNPAVTYQPGIDATGASLGNSSFINAIDDAYSSYEGAAATYTNLSSAFTGGYYDAPQSAYYYNYTGGGVPSSTTCYPNSSYTLVVVGAAEQQNFANWYSYYRTRIQLMKSSLGGAFSTLNNTYRVGFSTINDNTGGQNNSGANFINITNFDAVQKPVWYQGLYSIQPTGGTPLQEALRKDGEYYSTGIMPGAISTDPVQYSCQQNYTIISTDGFWNATPPTIGDWDATIPTLPQPVTGLTTGAQWPTPIWEGASATSDTMADMAMKYWVTDLRPTMTDNVSANSADPATWQHMTTFTIGLADGTLIYPGGLPTTTTPNWPVPISNTSTTIDDLWHAAVNGHGAYLNAKDPVKITNSLSAILNTIVGRTGSAAAISVANAHVTSTDNASYVTNYNSGTWSGELNAYAIDLTTGLPTTTPLWTAGSARDQLDLLTSSARMIATSTDVAGSTGGVQFQPITAATTTKLSTSQQTLLNTPSVLPVDGAAVLAYLRGDRSGETAGTYRVRAHLLGDTVNAEPAVVVAPGANYTDTGYQGLSTTFKETNASRTRMVYQGANDGMLHAFRAATGAEVWAYVPNLVMASLNNLSSITSFTHQYRVDGTPVSGDVDFKNTVGATGGGTDWRTILVGGLGKGGRGYYALDATCPDTKSDCTTAISSEVDVAGKVLWEFPNSVSNSSQRSTATLNSGYSFGKPIIVKTRAAGWVALITSGYNNGTNAGDSGGDGLGHLFVVNPRTGDLIKDIPTTGCTTTPTSTPCGLAQIAAYVDNTTVDNTTDFVYGGDLMGNVWRFDLSTASSSGWSVSKFAVLRDTGGATQPVTTTPLLANITINGTATRFVYVGTGQYLGNSDVPASTSPNSHATQTQTMYGLVDDTVSTLPDPLRSSLQVQTLTVSGTTITGTSNTVNFSLQKGWYADLPTTGERANTDPTLAVGILTFTTNIPNATVCVPGGSSNIYSFDYKTGSFLMAAPLGNTLASRVVLIQLPNGQVVAVVRLSNGTTIKQNVSTPPSGTTTSRTSWREIFN